MLNTPCASLPYPEDTDLPDVNTHLQNLATALDTLTVPRFTSSSTRGSTITAPTDGQAAYLQDTEELTLYRAGYNAWQPLTRARVYKLKTADESLNSSTTFQDDNHLQGITLKASTSYIFKGILFFASSAAADIKFQMAWTVSPDTANSFWCIKNSRDISNDVEHRSATLTGTIAPATNGGFTHVGTIEGFVLTTSSTTVKLQWAQNTSDAGTTSVFAGSFIEFIEAF